MWQKETTVAATCWQHIESQLNCVCVFVWFWQTARKRHCQEAHSGQLPFLPGAGVWQPILCYSPHPPSPLASIISNSTALRTVPLYSPIVFLSAHSSPLFSISLKCLLSLQLWPALFRSSILRPLWWHSVEINCMHQKLSTKRFKSPLKIGFYLPGHTQLTSRKAAATTRKEMELK